MLSVPWVNDIADGLDDMSGKPSLLSRLFGGKKATKQDSERNRETARIEPTHSTTEHRQSTLASASLKSAALAPTMTPPVSLRAPAPMATAPTPTAPAPAPNTSAPAPAPMPTAAAPSSAPISPAPAAASVAPLTPSVLTAKLPAPAGDCVLAMSADVLAAANVPADFKVERASTEAGDPIVKVSGGSGAAAPGGQIASAFTVRLPDEIEAKANGRTITVIVTARSAGADAANFATAYSTNGVGNSGWRDFVAGPKFTNYEFEYALKVAPEPNGNFVGILPKNGAALEIAFIAVRIH